MIKSSVAALAFLATVAQTPSASLPRVAIATEAGTIVIEVDPVRAPVTAANFLRYVDAGHFDGGRFHRTVTTKPDNQPNNEIKIDVIQAGANPAKAAEYFPPIDLEGTKKTGLTHSDGAVSMARGQVNTARDQFFICVGAQPELDAGGKRNPDGHGFAAFGRVVSGMEIVKAIHTSPAQGQTLQPPIRILSAKRRH